MSRGGNTLGLLLAVACAVLLVLDAGRPAAAAADRCTQCSKGCAADCSDDHFLSRACEDCKFFRGIGDVCKRCRDLAIKSCTTECYAEKCAVLEGCPVDVATLCGGCRATCQSGCNSTAAAECEFECKPQEEVCLGCVKNPSFSQSNGGDGPVGRFGRHTFQDMSELVPGSVPCRQDCINPTSGLSRAGVIQCFGPSSASSSACVRCPPLEVSCEGCKTQAMARCNTRCVARGCVQGSGCPSVLEP